MCHWMRRALLNNILPKEHSNWWLNTLVLKGTDQWVCWPSLVPMSSTLAMVGNGWPIKDRNQAKTRFYVFLPEICFDSREENPIIVWNTKILNRIPVNSNHEMNSVLTVNENKRRISGSLMTLTNSFQRKTLHRKQLKQDTLDPSFVQGVNF